MITRDRSLRRTPFAAPLLLAACLMLAGLPLTAQDFTITPTDVPNATVGAEYEPFLFMTTNGQTPIDWSFGNSTLPPNFVIGRGPADNPTAGIFCWGVIVAGQVTCGGKVATPPGSYYFTVRARDGLNRIAERNFTMLVTDDLVIQTDQQLPDAAVSEPYEVVLAAAGGTGNYLWSVIDGALPDGYTLNAATGKISGTTGPVNAGSYTFTVRVTDSVSSATEDRVFQLNVIGGLEITTTSLPLLIRGEPMEPFQMLASGADPADLQWQVSSGWSLPGAMTLSSDGILTGGVSQTGTYEVRIQVKDTISLDVTFRIYKIYVTLGLLGIAQNELPVAAQNTLYQTQLMPAGGLSPYTWTFGTLNTQGLSIDLNTGLITGTPPITGTFQLPVSIRDATGAQFTRTFQLVVTNEVVILTQTLPSGQIGEAYSQTLKAAGGQAPYRWEVTAGQLPQGLSLDGVFGKIQGTPVENGGSTFTIQVRDNVGRTFTRQLAIVIGNEVVILTETLPDAVRNQNYSFAIQALGGAGPYLWSVDSLFSQKGAGSNVLTIDPNNGVISGTPDTLDTLTLTIRVTDASQVSATKQFTLIVADPLVITGPTLSANVGSAYNSRAGVSGGRAPYTWSLTSGQLPGGLTLNAATGDITGVPTAQGTFSFAIQVDDAGGQTTLANRTMMVGAIPPLSVTTNALSPTVGTAFSQTLQAQGGTPPYTWSVESGNLSSFGLSLNASTGVVSGTPENYQGTITIRVTDATSQFASKAFTIMPALPPLPDVSIEVPSSATSGDQIPITIRISAPYATELGGTLQVQLESTYGQDQTVRQATLGPNFGFKVGETVAVAFEPNGIGPQRLSDGPPILATGSTAGTIHLTATIGPTATAKTATADITIAPAAPGITSVSVGPNGTVTVDGYANTHAVDSTTVTFTPTSGNSLQQSTFTFQLGDAFYNWFSSSNSAKTGGQFRLTIPFSISGGTRAGIASASVSLTNSEGTSNSMSGQ